jgi:hypothetical protein
MLRERVAYVCCGILAQTGHLKLGRACPLCPGISDINLFRYCQGVIDLDA